MNYNYIISPFWNNSVDKLSNEIWMPTIKKTEIFNKKNKIFGQINIIKNEKIRYGKLPFKPYNNKKFICAIDSGIKSFQTFYSIEEVGNIGNQSDYRIIFKKKLEIEENYKNIKNIKNKHKIKLYKLQINKLNLEIKNLIEELHNNFSNYLVKNYHNIFIPDFSIESKKSKKYKKKIYNDYNPRIRIDNWLHIEFRKKLIEKSKKNNCTIYIVNEEYTSRTCSNCSIINNVKCLREISCYNCKIQIDRDLNASKNILLKNIHLVLSNF